MTTNHEPDPTQTGMTGRDDYEARARAERDWAERYGGLTPDQAQAGYEADLEGESYADRFEAWMAANEPESEPEWSREDAEASAAAEADAIRAHAAELEAQLDPYARYDPPPWVAQGHTADTAYVAACDEPEPEAEATP